MAEIRRIYITGGAGAGKTTLARSLGAEINVPIVELDDIMWNMNGDGKATSPQARKRSVNELVAQPGWIAEGSYVGPAQEIWNKSDLIVFIEAGLPTVLWRIFWRHVKAELKRDNKHPGWRNLLRFMKIVIVSNRSSHVGDLDSDNDEPKLTLARLMAKREQHKEKVLVVGSSPNIDEILAAITSN
jgi:adenylate kinase family enzyme